MKRLATLFALLCSMAAVPSLADEDVCAARSVRVLVGFPPGGATDLLVRLITPSLSESLHRPFIVENHSGAAGTIATDIAAKAPPDGCTLLAVSAAFASNVYLYSRARYDPLINFTPVARIASVHNVLVVHPSLPVHTVAELVDYTKAHPGQLAFGNAGNGSTSHLAMELLRTRVGGFNVLEVPYRGVGPLVVDLLGGDVEAAVVTTPAAAAHVRSGALRALAVASLKRLESMPTVPTFEESGFPRFEVAAWNGVVAPAGISYDKVVRLDLAIASAVRLRDVKEHFATQGAEPIGDTPDEFRSYIRNEMAKWERVVRVTGVRLD